MTVQPLFPVSREEPLTIPWWRDRLYARLMARRPDVRAADDWFTGNHPAPATYGRARDMLRSLLDAAGANFLSLLVEAAVERMQVEGFRNGGKNFDEPWEIWQGNNFDAASEMVLLESMALGESSILVSPERNPAEYPTMTPEHPEQAIVEFWPGTQVRAAGLKVFTDDMRAEPVTVATLILPDRVETFHAPVPRAGVAQVGTVGQPRWEHQPSLSGPNPLEEVSLVDFPNRPRMLKAGSPEFTRVITIQRRINKTLLDRLVNQEYGAFKQKWATGLDIPEDENGQPIEPFNVAIDRLFTGTSPESKFGQFEPEDIAALLSAVESDVKHMAAIVPTPPDYLLGEMVNISDAALKSAQAGLIMRVRKHMRHREEPLETVARLSLKAAGLSVPNVSAMQTVWRNPETRTEGELVDSLVKMRTLGVPLRALWERYGATPQEIADWPAQLAEESADPTLERIARDLTGGGDVAPVV